MGMTVQMLYENDLLDAWMNANIQSDEDTASALIEFFGDDILYEFSI